MLRKADARGIGVTRCPLVMLAAVLLRHVFLLRGGAVKWCDSWVCASQSTEGEFEVKCVRLMLSCLKGGGFLITTAAAHGTPAAVTLISTPILTVVHWG